VKEQSATHDGGPAFPGGHGCVTGPTVGMSLRDYFAAHAPEVPQWWFDQRPQDGMAAFAYWYADEMLKERAK
jgi:hypothetical protein